MKLVSVVPTPNPDALKFTVEEELIREGSRSFTSQAAAEKDEVASKLFALDGVTSVFYMANFVTVNKSSEMSWDTLESQILAVLRDHKQESIEDAQELSAKPEVSERDTTPFSEMTPAQKILAIDKILEDEIRPGLAGDGGGLEVVGLEENVLQVHYEGACESCPSSTAGTLQYIESTLRSQLDDQLQVVPV